ncbi:MAG: hypothetical protein K2L81_05835, partial [Muribaculaceae bacterium]|nr:hypothetical protein [Muribaculaceae bacterium]
AMALVSAFTSQAQSQADVDNMMTQVASQMNQMLTGTPGIQGVTYDKTTHGLYVNIDKTLTDLCEAGEMPRSEIKANMIEGMLEEGGAKEFKDLLTMLNQLNVKFGIRYTYQGKRYTDLFYPSDFK